MAEAIAVENLQKLFPRMQSGWRAYLQPFSKPTVPALRDISFSVGNSEAVGLLGTNGAGKTTLLRILATLLLPTGGNANVGGFDAVRDPAEVRRNLGYHAGSDLGFYARLTARQNLQFFGLMNHLGAAEVRERIATLAGQFGVEGELGKQVRTLSSGTIQRLSLMRALLHRPKVLLLDEPTRSLDAIAAAEFRQFLRREIVAGTGTSLLFASHSLAEIEFLAHRVILMHQGRVLASGTVTALKSKYTADTLEEAFVKATGTSLTSTSGGVA